eukprot:SAG11_NODE_641_length_8008_cov_2.916171_2_plen_52_part_00
MHLNLPGTEYPGIRIDLPGYLVINYLNLGKFKPVVPTSRYMYRGTLPGTVL